jgi:hypothetical protein
MSKYAKYSTTSLCNHHDDLLNCDDAATAADVAAEIETRDDYRKVCGLAELDIAEFNDCADSVACDDDVPF